MLGYWRNDGVGAWADRASKLVSGLGTTSMFFDGTDDTLSIPDHADFDIPSGDYCIDFWLKVSSSQQDGII